MLKSIEEKVTELLPKLKAASVNQALLNVDLTAQQLEHLEKINDALCKEYECRRRMLIKRLDVTVQSFGWSDKAKAKMDEIARVYQPIRYSLSPKSGISVPHLLAARRDLSKIVRTSSGSAREKMVCPINKILMGRVPDRGGRPSEISPPPPEMPPWKKRQDDGGRGGWRGGGRGGGGGYGRGGYNAGASNFNRGGQGGYQGRGGYGDGGYGGRGTIGDTECCVLRVIDLVEGEPSGKSEVQSTLEEVFIQDISVLGRIHVSFNDNQSSFPCS
ncbi:unnamed protein product, partial [Ranitomeya imitator]